jgi:hypothetical protein
MAMPGLPTEAQALCLGVGDVFRPRDIVRVGTIVRVHEALGPAVDWREAGDGTALAGAPSVARTVPGQLSPAPTATAAPSRVVTVKAPTERRTISRARDPGTCHLPRDATSGKLVRHSKKSAVDPQSARLRCWWPPVPNLRPLAGRIRRDRGPVGLSRGLDTMGHRVLRVTRIAVIGGLFALLSTGITPSVAKAQTSIYIVQGLPSRTVSVTIDGDEVVGGLAGGKVAGPFAVKSGTRSVTFTDGGQTLVTSKVRLPAGSNSEIVVHLPASPTGDPVVTRFDNNLQSVQHGKAAEAVAHVAAAGPMDIRVDGKVVFANVAVGEYLYKVVPAMTNSVDFVRTGKSKTLLGPVDVMVEPSMLTWVFAIGRPGKDLALVKHVIALSNKKGSHHPSRVDTGTGGQAAELAARSGR